MIRSSRHTISRECETFGRGWLWVHRAGAEGGGVKVWSDARCLK